MDQSDRHFYWTKGVGNSFDRYKARLEPSTLCIMYNITIYNDEFQKTYKKRNYVSTLSLKVVLTNTLINIQHFLIFLFSLTSVRFDTIRRVRLDSSCTSLVLYDSIRLVLRWFCSIRFDSSSPSLVRFDSIHNNNDSPSTCRPT